MEKVNSLTFKNNFTCRYRLCTNCNYENFVS